MTKVINFLKGKKTYIAGFLLIVVGVLQESYEVILEGVAIMALRAGLKK